MTNAAALKPDAAVNPDPRDPTMFAIVRLNTFDEHKLATATGDLHEFGRPHASQPGYAGSLTVALGEGRHLTVNLWDSEQQAAAGLSNLRVQVGRAFQPLMTAPTQLIGAGPATTDLSATAIDPVPTGPPSSRSQTGCEVSTRSRDRFFGAYDSSLKVPVQLRRSLTWDQGKEMAEHRRDGLHTGTPGR